MFAKAARLPVWVYSPAPVAKPGGVIVLIIRLRALASSETLVIIAPTRSSAWKMDLRKFLFWAAAK